MANIADTDVRYQECPTTRSTRFHGNLVSHEPCGCRERLREWIPLGCPAEGDVEVCSIRRPPDEARIHRKGSYRDLATIQMGRGLQETCVVGYFQVSSRAPKYLQTDCSDSWSRA